MAPDCTPICQAKRKAARRTKRTVHIAIGLKSAELTLLVMSGSHPVVLEHLFLQCCPYLGMKPDIFGIVDDLTDVSRALHADVESLHHGGSRSGAQHHHSV